MEIMIVLLGIALAVSIAGNLGYFGKKAASSPGAASNTPSTAAASRSDSNDDRARKLESELDKKRKELEEAKKSWSETKDELKAAKKKLFDQTQAHKAGDDLSKERAEVERQASIQLENTRAELATALAEVQRLKAVEENRGKKKADRPVEAAPAKVEEKPVEKPQEVVTRVIRELSDAEKERINKLETQSANDRKRANEADRELRNLKAKVDRIQREGKRVFAEANLTRDKFRAVETRLNRTLLENDLLRRAITALEKKTGLHAEHTTPTTEDIAKADAELKARHDAEDKAEAEAKAKLEAAPATTGDEAPAAATETAATETPAAQA